MKIGVVFPQTDIGNDPAGIRDHAQAVEAMGKGRGSGPEGESPTSAPS